MIKVLRLFCWMLLAWFSYSSMACAADDVRSALDLVRTRNFIALESQWTQLEQSKKKNLDGIYVFYRVSRNAAEELAKDPVPALDSLNAWCTQDSYLCHLERGRFYLYYAWADRGTEFADKVLPEAWHVFEERLNLAVKDLDRAAVLNPQSPEPWISLMVAYRGLSRHKDVEESFNKAVAIDPTHFGVYSAFLVSKMEKWGGSNEDMFNFAQRTYNEHRAADPVFGFLLLESHDELADRLKLKTGGKKSDYYLAPANEAAMRAILADIVKVYPQSPKARNWEAKINYFAKHYPEALSQMTALQSEDAVDELVWSLPFFEKTKTWLERQHAQGKF